MRNSIPTHYAITQAQAGKIQTYASYANAILVLIGHDYQDGIDGESDEFLTSSHCIRTALSAVRHFVNEIEENTKGGVYLTPEAQTVKGVSANGGHAQLTPSVKVKGGENA